MQDYITLRIDARPCNETVTDLLAAFLADEGYDSFSPDEDGLFAYIRADLFKEENVNEILENFPIDVEFTSTHETVEGKDWNEEWEKNYFQPISVDGKVVVHSSFHTDIPEGAYDIVIDPKMAFGTGHHATTCNMIRSILQQNMENKTVIDMGTGTGILAILAKMMGAKQVTGIEIDPFAKENAVENARLNNVEVNLICGDAQALGELEPADYFFANINRNVILNDLAQYLRKLKKTGKLILSGFYNSDIPIVENAADQFSLRLKEIKEDNEWVALIFEY